MRLPFHDHKIDAAATEQSPNQLARRSLTISASLALLGSLASLPQIVSGSMRGGPEYLLLASIAVELGFLLTLLLFPRIRTEPLAVTATVYFGVYLSAGCMVSLKDPQQAVYFILFFLWYSPLLVFNRLVNHLAVAKITSKLLLVVPLGIVAVTWSHLRQLFPANLLFILVNLSLSHLMLGTMLEPLTRFRAAYTLEKSRVEAMEAKAALLEHTAFYDALTHLPNRAALKRHLGGVLQAPVHSVAGLLLIDVDHFRTLNDVLGHAIGDLLLQAISDRLLKVQAADKSIFHLGGDEFAFVLEALPPELDVAAQQAADVAARICGTFSQIFQIAESECLISASIGICLSSPGATTGELLKQADLALMRAKANGRNCACTFTPEMDDQVAARVMFVRDLQRALTNGEFTLVYQPQIDAAGQLIGAEALIRWSHPTRGMVPPCDFVPLAEEAGLIVSIGQWVLETACAQLTTWSTVAGLDHLTVSVNVSVRQLTSPRFVADVEQALARGGLSPYRLKLEITETAVMERIEESIARMKELRDKGIRFSLDDFGTGHSSLAYLKRLPLDQLKVDRSFVSGVLASETDASITRTIILLARSLGIEVIAEGVETEEQRRFLASEGCFRYQGYLFSRPLSTAQFESFAGRSSLSAAQLGSAPAPLLAAATSAEQTVVLHPRSAISQ